MLGALEAHRTNVNFNLHSGNWPGSCETIDSYVPLGTAQAGSSGGPWRSVYVTRHWRFGGPGVPSTCSAGTADHYTDIVGAIVGVCGEGNTSGLITGSDDACYCPTGSDWSDDRQRCVNVQNFWHAPPPPEMCKFDPGSGNPIFPLSGSKRQVVSLGFQVGPEAAELVYETRALVPYAPGSAKVNGKAAFLPNLNTGLPSPWSSNLHKGLAITAESIQAHRGAGRWISFARSGSVATAPAGVNDRLVASGTGWRYEDQTAGATETYDAAGRIQGLASHSGSRLSYLYSDSTTPVSQAPTVGLLIGMADQQGRSVSFHHDAVSRLTRITTADGSVIQLTYDNNGSLAQLTWPDGTSQRFLYERSDLP